MAAIKSMSAIAEKWARMAAAATPDYEAGVRDASVDWASAALAAAASYASGVQAAIAAGSYSKGVSAAGTAKWRAKTLLNGVARWAAGVATATGDYSRGFQPFQSAIASMTLPARYARRDPRNLQRVKAVVDTMIAAAGKR